MDPIAKKWYYDLRFNGSASINKVRAVLALDITYLNLCFQDGDDALAKYLSFINDSLPPVERVKIKYDLLVYCKLNSLAMVRILYEVRKFI